MPIEGADTKHDLTECSARVEAHEDERRRRVRLSQAEPDCLSISLGRLRLACPAKISS